MLALVVFLFFFLERFALDIFLLVFLVLLALRRARRFFRVRFFRLVAFGVSLDRAGPLDFVAAFVALFVLLLGEGGFFAVFEVFAGVPGGGVVRAELTFDFASAFFGFRERGFEVVVKSSTVSLDVFDLVGFGFRFFFFVLFGASKGITMPGGGVCDRTGADRKSAIRRTRPHITNPHLGYRIEQQLCCSFGDPPMFDYCQLAPSHPCQYT